MSADFDLPPELVCRPLALVGLAGLHTETSAVHRAIWESFISSNRTERPPLNLVQLQPDHVFPPAKPTRTSYEWYIPKGILKRSWMSKHLYKIPALVVLFYDLEWDDPAWKAKHAECASLLENLRAALTGRTTKLVLVLVQNNPPLPTGEDILAAERAAALCQACDLAPKSLFVLPSRSDHLQGYILRLESAFYELCQSSYHQSARAVRAHRDQLNRTNHGYLFIRHQFKMGFYNELKQDVATANKHYTQAYSYIQDLRITDANVTEVKTIAGYIGYKIWKLTFIINFPRDAITHFRSHVDFFKMRIGNPALKFEHHSWLATQYAVFAGLFQEAIDLGLPPIQTQHPGFFYQQAAQQAVFRKKSVFNELDAFEEDDEGPLPNVDFSSLEYYGQRPWRPGRLSLEPSDMKQEMRGIHSLLLLEKERVPHTQLIVGLLSNAVNQFKNYRSPRMKQLLLVQMAEEYAENGNYTEALTLLEPLLWEYRKDYWWRPLTSLLQLGLNCAYLAARIPEYFNFAVELCSSRTTNTTEEKRRIFANLIKIINGQCPDAEVDLDAESAQNGCRLWVNSFREAPDGYPLATVVTSTVCTFLDVRATFLKPHFAANQAILLQLHVRYNGPEEIQFSQLAVELSNAAYSAHCREEKLAKLLFQPKETKVFDFAFAAEPDDVGREIQIKAVNVKLGTAKYFAVLRCEGASSDDFGPLSARSEFVAHRKPPKSIEDVAVLPSAQVLQKQADIDLQVDLAGPVLQGEQLPVTLTITNREKHRLTNLDVRVSTDKGSVQVDGKQGDHVNVQVPDIDENQSQSCLAYLRCHDVGTCAVTIIVTCKVDDEVCGRVMNFCCRYEKTVSVECVDPLQCVVEYQSCEFQTLARIPLGEDCVVLATLVNLSPFPLILESARFLLDKGICSKDDPAVSQLNGIVVEPGEKGSDIIVVNVSPSREVTSQLEPGKLTLQWKRFLAETDPFSKLPPADSSFALPPVELASSPLHVEVTAPAYGYVRKPLHAALSLRNDSDAVMELDVVMESNDAFMFAGNKQIKARILPGHCYDLTYNLYPLLSGFVALPPLRVSSSSSKENEELQALLEEVMKRNLPSHIFVLPQNKEKRNESAISA